MTFFPGMYNVQLRSCLKKRLAALASPPGPNEDVEHNAILIGGAPEMVLHASDSDEDLVHAPLVPRPRPAAA
jgi:hypothetical protein